MKFSGMIGFWQKDVQVKPGVFKPGIIEKPYTGNVLRNIRQFQTVENQQNEDLKVNNQISIISRDLLDNWGSIRYVLWNGVKWKATSVDLSNYPRVVIQLGGVYNGKTSTT